ncbi:MAG: S8 family serine peptidase [Gemmatimonadota bacterium]|nr:S8 family serine peptidase [Gemmatimonadota bacterium]
MSAVRTVGVDSLPGATGVGISIVVIDSGVNPDHPHIAGVAGGVGFTPDGSERPDHVDRLGHGTAVTAAIQEKAPAAEIYVVKVFDDALATSVATLVRAIDWATDRGVTIVNLSLGTPNAHRAEVLAPAVERAVRRGTLIISAREHDGVEWLPGSLEGVLGVVLDPDCPRDAVRVDPTLPGLGASPYPRPIPGVPPERNLNGISFAVANATGLVARALEVSGDAERATAAKVLAMLGTLAGSAPPTRAP